MFRLGPLGLGPVLGQQVSTTVAARRGLPLLDRIRLPLSVRAASLPTDGECRGLLFESALSPLAGTSAVGHLCHAR